MGFFVAGESPWSLCPECVLCVCPECVPKGGVRVRAPNACPDRMP